MKPARRIPAGLWTTCEELPFAVKWHRELEQHKADNLFSIDLGASESSLTAIERAHAVMLPEEQVMARSMPAVLGRGFPARRFPFTCTADDARDRMGSL